MKRDPALVPLSHDHHHALVQARRLRRASGGPDAAAVAAGFLQFLAAETLPHFRLEEELLFPEAVDHAEAREPLVRTLLEHQRLRALAAELERRLAAGEAPDEVMDAIGRLLEEHVRHEERVLFPLIERLCDAATLTRLGRALREHRPEVAERRRGPIWGAESDDLNATLLEWPPAGGPPEHVNDTLDVLLVVVDGSATVTVDGDERQLTPGEALIVGRGRTRRIVAGPEGVRYLTAHRRRPPLQIASRAQGDEGPR